MPTVRTRDMSGSNGSSPPDYSTLEFPDKPRTEWHYSHRRAELLQLVREAGHPDDLNQTELAERYDVSQQQISKDLSRLGAHIRANVDLDRRALVVNSVIQRSIRGMMNDGNFRQAAKTAMEWDEWVSEGNVPSGNNVSQAIDSESNAELAEMADNLF